MVVRLVRKSRMCGWGSGMSIGWRQQFGDVVVRRRGISGCVVRACECVHKW